MISSFDVPIPTIKIVLLRCAEKMRSFYFIVFVQVTMVFIMTLAKKRH